MQNPCLRIDRCLFLLYRVTNDVIGHIVVKLFISYFITSVIVRQEVHSRTYTFSIMLFYGASHIPSFQSSFCQQEVHFGRGYNHSRVFTLKKVTCQLGFRFCIHGNLFNGRIAFLQFFYKVALVRFGPRFIEECTWIARMRHIFSQYLFSDINAPFSTGCTHYLVKVEPYDSKKPRVTSIEQLIIKSRADKTGVIARVVTIQPL